MKNPLETIGLVNKNAPEVRAYLKSKQADPDHLKACQNLMLVLGNEELNKFLRYLPGAIKGDRLSFLAQPLMNSTGGVQNRGFEGALTHLVTREKAIDSALTTDSILDDIFDIASQVAETGILSDPSKPKSRINGTGKYPDNSRQRSAALRDLQIRHKLQQVVIEGGESSESQGIIDGLLGAKGSFSDRMKTVLAIKEGVDMSGMSRLARQAATKVLTGKGSKKSSPKPSK